jgi:hypothetical protein
VGSAEGSTAISSDSPVREALFTFISLLLNTTISQGMFSPPFTTTTSPGTISLASISYGLPSRITDAFAGIKFSNWAIISADFDVWAYEKHPVTQVTTASTTPK